MTDPTGRSFLSYRRSRLEEAKLLIHAQHELGIPTWQDIRNLDEEPTEQAIRGVLNDELTANAVLWLTPDVAQSAMIQKVEAPLILKRYQRNDGFFVVPVVAGGLAYDAAGSLLSGSIGIQDLKNWNLRKVEEDPASEDEAWQIARRVLQRRIGALHGRMASGEPVRVLLNTRQVPAIEAGVALTMDWTHRFNGRTAPSATGTRYLLPALEEVARVVQEQAPGRGVLPTGLLSIPAATALGKTFLAPRKISIGWEQFTPGRQAQVWHLEGSPEDSEFEEVVTAGDVQGNDLAVMVSAISDVTGALAASKHQLPRFRAYVHVKRQPNSMKTVIETPEQARHLAHLVIEAARNARTDYDIRGSVHLFMAVPAGLAMLIGQLLNTLGKVQTYEHIQEGATGRYEAAAQLTL